MLAIPFFFSKDFMVLEQASMDGGDKSERVRVGNLRVILKQ